MILNMYLSLLKTLCPLSFDFTITFTWPVYLFEAGLQLHTK